MTDLMRTLTGVVVSDKRDKTLSVRVTRVRRHPLYKKVQRLNSKFQVHDPDNRGKQGDTVTIKEVRPISKTKCWELVEITSQ